jgi:hypothetical protein
MNNVFQVKNFMMKNQKLFIGLLTTGHGDQWALQLPVNQQAVFCSSQGPVLFSPVEAKGYTKDLLKFVFGTLENEDINALSLTHQGKTTQAQTI